MRWSAAFLNTLREPPGDAEAVSHVLMLRSGMIQKVAAGIFTYLPMGLRAMRKLEAIVREEMNREGAIELLMPSVQPAELWQESGRWKRYGKELLRIKDRHDRDYCFGPTHEEVITDTVRKWITSYRQLPVNLYQIQTKFRDEIRPRFGLMRGREFSMKDAYSFDSDEKGLEAVYEKMIRAYSAIFRRCQLDFTMVESDVGAIGGASAHEFMVLAQTGEDAVVRCPSCGYGANVEKATTADLAAPAPAMREPAARRDVATPGSRTIEEVSSHLGITPAQCAKTLVYETEKDFVVAIVRGDLSVNDVKLKNHLVAEFLEMASDGKGQTLFGVPPGSWGPFGIVERKARIVVDRSVAALRNVVTGANREGYHTVDVDPARDFDPFDVADIVSARAGDPCPRCRTGLELARGIEVGNIFKLGTKYSIPMDCAFLDENGERRPMVMGCYGLGIGRTVAAVVEQNHDDEGIIWPAPLAPFDVHLVAMNVKDPATVECAEAVYRELQENKIDVFYDDRDERAGVKFKDADLLGFPIRINIGGRSLKEGNAELSHRHERRPEPLAIGQIVEAAVAAVRRGKRTA